MRDGDVRKALHVQLQSEHAAELDQTLFVDELGLCGQVRVDVAVVNGSLSGYELKSENDTLRRLPTQVEVYSRVLDFATLVVAKKHAAHARACLPSWWGLIEAESAADGSVTLKRRRRGRMNPSVDPLALAQLLWRDEALAELEARGMARGVRSKPRLEIWQRLSVELPLEELREVVRLRLKGRQGWRSAPSF
jgi:hypothetical protein